MELLATYDVYTGRGADQTLEAWVVLKLCQHLEGKHHHYSVTIISPPYTLFKNFCRKVPME